MILGKSDFDHVQSLKAVLGILKEYDLRLEMKHRIFTQPEVIYLGFRINKEDSRENWSIKNASPNKKNYKKLIHDVGNKKTK